MEYFDRCLEAIDRMDSEQLTETLSDAEKNLAELFMQEDLIAPLIQHMQDECRNGTLRMAQKHMAEGVIRSHLLNYATRPGTGSVFRVVVAGGLAGADELPLLRLAVATRAYGWRPVYLGAGLSADEIAYAAEHSRALCTAIAAHPVDDSLLPNELRKLRHAITGRPPDPPARLQPESLRGGDRRYPDHPDPDVRRIASRPRTDAAQCPGQRRAGLIAPSPTLYRIVRRLITRFPSYGFTSKFLLRGAPALRAR